MKISSILLIFVVSCVSVNGAWQQCATMGTPGTWTIPPGSNVQIPSLPQTFQTKVEATIIDQGYTRSAEEYYDGPNNRASMKIIQNGDIQLIIYDYSNDQILYVDKDGGCVASNLETDLNNLVFGDVIENGKHHAYSTGRVLEFAKEFGELYIGDATIRGIPCDHWRSCMSWPMLKANFTLDYYFAKPSWKTSFPMTTTPVRAEVVGRHMGAAVAGPGRDFHHIYEYIDFRAEIDDDPTTIFEVPKGTFCNGRVSPRPIPELPGQFYHRKEIVSSGDQVINMVDIYYDYSYQLARYDYRPTVPAYPYYSTDPVTEIHDYNVGVAYAIDKMVGNCTIMPIENSTVHGDMNIAVKGSVLQMKNPNQLFSLDNTYVYNGQRRARGIICDVFAAIRTDFSIPGMELVQALFEYYFLPATWIERANLGTTMVTDVPVMLEITGIGGHPSLSSFDIGACFNSSQRINFEAIFSLHSIPTIRKNHRLMALEGLTKIAQLTNLHPIRIQHVRVRYDEDGVYLSGSLHESPQPIGTLQGKGPTVSMNDAWNSMRDNVFKGLFMLQVAADGGKVVEYKATDIYKTTACRADAVGTTSADATTTTTVSSAETTQETVSTVSAYDVTYIGCYKDETVRDLDGYFKLFESSNSKTTCTHLCYKSGFKYGGMQNKEACRCGNSFGKYGKLSEADCNTPCSGNAGEICGGWGANSIYATGL